MTPEARHDGRRLALLAVGVLVAGTMTGAALGASRLGIVVPPASAGSLGDAAAILGNNLRLAALLAALALLQPQGVPGLSPGFLPLWLTDVAFTAVVALNLLAIGAVVGALGLHALARIVPHAPPEVGGFLVLVVAYLRCRRGVLERREALGALGLAGLLLACGALVESYVSGSLS